MDILYKTKIRIEFETSEMDKAKQYKNKNGGYFVSAGDINFGDFWVDNFFWFSCLYTKSEILEDLKRFKQLEIA